jgi:AcrR family transcriptional regulator
LSTSTAAVGLRERSKLRRVDRILASARDLLRESDGEVPTVEAVAERAEVAAATVFNLIGTRENLWAALADQALAELEQHVEALPDHDPHKRARRIVSMTVDAICADAPVHRAVLLHWQESARLLRPGPTAELVRCLEAAADSNMIRADLDRRRLGEMIAVACTGAVHQWAARLIDDRTFKRRCRTAVDLAFAAAATTDEARSGFLADLARR